MKKATKKDEKKPELAPPLKDFEVENKLKMAGIVLAMGGDPYAFRLAVDVRGLRVAGDSLMALIEELFANLPRQARTPRLREAVKIARKGWAQYRKKTRNP